MKVILLIILFVFSFCEKYDTPVVGIDLGTTYSAVGIYRNKKVEIIPNEQGNRITPSIVSFTPSGGNLVGDSARNNIYYNPKNTLYDVKRLIGRSYDEVIKKDAKLLTYDIVNEDSKPIISVEVGTEKKKLRPEEISAMVLTKMKNIAESYLGTAIKHAVITVPAYFNDAQRIATKDAAKISGLNVIRIINEPTAAAMAYGLYKKTEQDILVFDLGGGTFDVSILTIENGTFQVLSTSGDTHLGGEDFDLRVVDYFSKMIKEKYQKDVKADPKAFQKLKIACEKAKRILSAEVETEIEIESLLEGVDFKQKLTRAKFEDLNKDLFQNTLKPVQQALSDAKLQKDDIDEVILVGGSTRIPFIRNQLQKFFNGKKLHLDVNPDEAIAYGAAVQAAVLSETIDDNIILMDVTPLSLGIETVGGVMAKIINRNTPIPTEKFDFFTTTEDYQKALVVPIYEGERTQTKHNRLLGELELTDLPPAKKGVPQIKVLFKLDKDGILTVTVADQANLKNTKSTTIKKSALTSEEIKSMTEDAEKNKKEDEEFRETVEMRNNLESYTSTLRSQLSDKNFANRMKSVDRKNISKALRKTLKWLRDNENATKKEYKKQLNTLKKVAGPVINKIFGRKEDFDLNLEDDDDDEEEEKKKQQEKKPEDLKKEETISVVEEKVEEKKTETKTEEKKPEETKKKEEL